MSISINTSDTREDLKQLLSDIATIALVGASPKSHRASNEVMAFLQTQGHRVIPINPGLAGKEILNERVIGTIAELDEKVDMIDIFRNSEAAGEVCDEILKLPKENRPKLVWMQIGVINHAAAEKLEKEGIKVVMDKCPKRVLDRSYEN